MVGNPVPLWNVAALRVTLTPSEDERLAERPIRNPRAFELYLKAQVLVRRYGASTDHVNALLDRAIEIEDLSPLLRTLRAYLWVAPRRAGMSTDAVHLARAEAEARELIDVAPNAAYGYVLLGFIRYESGALAEDRAASYQALEFDRSDADALFFRGIALERACLRCRTRCNSCRCSTVWQGEPPTPARRWRRSRTRRLMGTARSI